MTRKHRKYSIGLLSLGLLAAGCTQPAASTDAPQAPAAPATRRSPLDVPGVFMCRWPSLGDARDDAEWIRRFEQLHPDLFAPISGGIRGGDSIGS